MTGLTPRQWDVLIFVHRYISEHGYSPTYDEIANGVGIVAKSRVHCIVVALAQRGCVTRIANAKRSLNLTEDGVDRALTLIQRSVPRETSGAAA